MLTVLDGIDESIDVLLLTTEQVRLDERDHAIVFDEIVLQRCTGENDTTECFDFRKAFSQGRLRVLQNVAFVGDDDIRSGIDETFERVQFSDAGSVGQSSVHLVAHDHHSTVLVPMGQVGDA